MGGSSSASPNHDTPSVRNRSYCLVLVVAGVGLAAAKRKRGYLRGVGKVFRNKASTQRNRALKHLAKLDREVAAMKSERAREQARNRKIREREGRAARAADEAAGERADEEENQEADKDRRVGLRRACVACAVRRAPMSSVASRSIRTVCDGGV